MPGVDHPGEPRVEKHPFRYPWHERFPDAWRIALWEGGAAYTAEAEGGYWIITDEGTMADFLEPGEDDDLLASLVVLERYTTRPARDAALGRLRGPAGGAHPADPRQPPEAAGLAAEAERLFLAAAALAAPRLTELASRLGLACINEMRHLLPTFRDALEEVVAASAGERPAVSPWLTHGLLDEWPRLGNFDISLAWGKQAAFGELKCGCHAGALDACAWDALKGAFCRARDVGIAVFLIAVAPSSLWAGRDLGVELLFDGRWAVEDIRTRYAAGFRRWEGDGYRPLEVPRRFVTQAAGAVAFTIAGAPWMLGISRVEPLGDESFAWEPLLAQPEPQGPEGS